MPVEVILRMLVVKRLYGWSDEETEHLVADGLVLRQFCRLYLQPVLDDPTLLRWANVIGPQPLVALNERVVELARSLKVTRGRKLRVDSPVVETPIHHPTDSGLLADGVRVLSRLLGRAKVVIGHVTDLGQAVFRSRMRSGRRLVRQLHRLARRKGEGATEQLQHAYSRLIQLTQRSYVQAGNVSAVLRQLGTQRAQQLVRQFEQFLPRVAWVIDQTVRRVLHGEVVPAQDKLVSLFEPHTQIMVRRKTGKAVEFGRKVWLEEVEGGLISDSRILTEAGQDFPYLPDSLVAH